LRQILVRNKLTLPNDRTVKPYDCRVLDVNRLRILTAVVASRSVNETARRLGYTPSTVSQHIHTLEDEVGFRLVDRVGRGIVPTPAAVELASASTEVLDAMTRLTAQARELREGVGDKLTLRTFASAAYTWMPPVARTLRQEFRGLTLELSIIEADEARLAGEADIELHSELPFVPPMTVPGFRRTELGVDDLVMVMPPDHPLVGAGATDLAEFDEDDWVQYDFRDAIATRLAEHACSQAGFRPHYVARAQDHVTGLAFVSAGVGVALVPELALGWSAFDTPIVRLRNPTPQRRIVAQVRNAVATYPPAVRTLELLSGLASRLGQG
jgi:DNA-binding transcriptional LysR family regulator